jgi:hypothetical protein
MAFRYVVRSDADWERRAQQSGSQFVHFFKDEFRQYTPAKGENCVRILPPSSLWKNAPHYGLDVNVHYQVGPDRGSVICLDAGVPQIGNSGHPCPICQDMARHLRANDKDLAKELRPRRRVLTFVINRKDEAQGPLLWGMPYTLDQQISMIARDPSTGKWTLIDRPDDGFDVYFYREGEAIGTKYTGVQLAKRPSPVSDRHIEWVDRNPLPNTLKFRDYDEIKRIYEGIARGEGEDDGYERPPRDGYERPPRDYEPRSRGPEHGDPDETTPWEGQRGGGENEPELPVDEPPEEPTQPPPREEPEQPPPRAAVRRPRTPRGNGADATPPPRTATTSDAKSRADELRAQFLSKRGG